MNFYYMVIQFFIAVVLVLLYYKFIETRKIDKYTKKNNTQIYKKKYKRIKIKKT